MKKILLILIASILIIGIWILADIISKIVTMPMIITGLVIALIIGIIYLEIKERG